MENWDYTLVREGNHSYLAFECKEELTQGSGDYADEWRMLSQNRIEGLLPCGQRTEDGKTKYYYDISGKQSLERWYEGAEMNAEGLRRLLFSLQKVLRSTGEFMLSEDGISLLPDMIFYGIENDIAFFFSPVWKNDFAMSIRDFATYLLQKVDHTDEDAVFLAYQFYKYAVCDNFSLEVFLEQNRESLFTEEVETESMPVSNPEQAYWVEDNPYYEMPEVPESSKKNSSGKAAYYAAVVGAIAAAVLLWLADAQQAGIIVFASLCTLVGGIFLRERLKIQERRLREKEREIFHMMEEI